MSYFCLKALLTTDETLTLVVYIYEICKGYTRLLNKKMPAMFK